MPRKKPQPIPTYLPKELRQAAVLERNGFQRLANKLREDFHKRVLANDPTTGVAPWSTA